MSDDLNPDIGRLLPVPPEPLAWRALPSDLIRSLRGFGFAWVPMYLLTGALHFLLAGLRATVAYVPCWIVCKILGLPMMLVGYGSLAIGYGPFVFSLLTLIEPLGGWWFEMQAGGRRPSEREREVLRDAFRELRAIDPELRVPPLTFILDTPQPNAAVYADRLMISRALLESPHLPAVLAHELGHAHTSDARVAAALYRLTIPPRRHFGRRWLQVPLSLVTGAAVVWATRPIWCSYWRSREYAADAYAAHLGQGQTLAEFLEIHALENDLPVPFLWLSDESHPATELRIERLITLEEEHAEPIAGSVR